MAMHKTINLKLFLRKTNIFDFIHFILDVYGIDKFDDRKRSLNC